MHNMSLLLQQIQKYLPLTEADSEKILSYFSHKKYLKKSILLNAGEVCRFEAFIMKGCVKTYFIDKDGMEVILSFATEGWWVSDIASFHHQVPSRMWIETMEDSELLFIQPAAKEELLKNFPVLERMFRLLVQRHLTAYQERLFANIALSAEERYHEFLKKFPELPVRVPQHQIAAYIGISPEALSRLRSRKKQKPTRERD
jgi:CRP-like cAMP-binding protein